MRIIIPLLTIIHFNQISVFAQSGDNQNILDFEWSWLGGNDVGGVNPPKFQPTLNDWRLFPGSRVSPAGAFDQTLNRFYIFGGRSSDSLGRLLSSMKFN